MRSESHHEDGITGPSEGYSTRDNATAYRPLAFDPTPYLHHLADADLTDAQKVELLETLWQIMVHFVDLGMGISPIQQAMDKSAKTETSLEPGFTA
ncbi:hypothetical protein JHC09_15625 [Devosia sp. MC532]|uniref:hypothetical protein n=1 Tax=Devosia sp. MC532 TaxID=2799788 RepID=UPI0018F62A5C|nr:hypothetical protein [Devosia sp. MC532]MBJ7579306.1 hypothetical protein [Devosia sp. MC532]